MLLFIAKIYTIFGEKLPEIVDYKFTEVETHQFLHDTVNFIISDVLKENTDKTIHANGRSYAGFKSLYGGFALLLLNLDNTAGGASKILGMSEKRLFYTLRTRDAIRLIQASKNTLFPKVTLSDCLIEPAKDISEHQRCMVELTKEYLEGILFKHDAIMSVYSKDFGKDIIAVVVQYGFEKLLYAVYGVWEDEKEAQKYGYKAGERIYMSKPKPLIRIQDPQGVVAAIINLGKMEKKDGGFVNILPSMVSGEKHWSYDQVLAHSEEIFPQLTWCDYPLNSTMPVEYDEHGVAKRDNNGLIPPPGPDKYSLSTNPPPTNSCPDMETYFDLYCECAKPMLLGDYDEAKSSASSYMYYKDYLNKSMMEEDWDGTVYSKDGLISTQEASTEYQPEEPYLFDNDGNLLNKGLQKIYDPFKNELGLINVKWGRYGNIFQWGHIVHTWYLTDKIRPILYEVVDFYRTYLKDDPTSLLNRPHTYASITMYNREYMDEDFYIGNPADKYRAYEKDEQVVLFDEYFIETGHVLKTEVKYETGDHHIHADNDKKEWFLIWRWPVVFKDKVGIKKRVGSVTYKRKFLTEKGKLERRGQKLGLDYFKDRATEHVIGKGSHRCNQRVYVLGMGDKSLQQMAGYNKKSKDYYTDQKDVADRDEEIEKGEGINEIILKIVVAEALNLTMKGLYKIAEKKEQAIPLYEVAKRLENRLTQARTYKMAKELYKVYCIWKTTMDLLKDAKDTYRSISQAWDGLMYAVTNFGEYYKNLDFKSIRLTNIATILPINHLKMVDTQLYSLQASINDFELALDALAFQSDKITKGHYGPIKPLVFTVTRSLRDIKLSSGENTTRIIEENSKRLDKLTGKTGTTASQACYLSNITATIQTVTSVHREPLYNDRIKALGTALMVTETETKDWIEYANFMYSIPGKFSRDFSNGEWQKAPLTCIVQNLYHRKLFSKENELILKDNFTQ